MHLGLSHRGRLQDPVGNWVYYLTARVVLSDVLGGKDVVEGRDGRTDGRLVLSIRYWT
jgi:hypothetical protein